MSSIVYKYKKRIQELNPLQDSSFIYDSNRWSKLNTQAKKLVVAYENKEINRKVIVNAFIEYYQDKKDWQYPFVMTMIWGLADTGYGTFRTNNYLASEENQNNIKNAFEAIRGGDQKEAFKLLMKIEGLNISYVSKLLYFATRALNVNGYALIFDIRVARSLVKLLNNDGIEGLLNIAPSTKYKDFENYNILMHRWANELNVEAESIEMFLFNGEF
jgi:hypothetical protein